MRFYSIALLFPLLLAGESPKPRRQAPPAVAPPRVLMIAGRVLVLQPDTNFVELSRELIPGIKINGGCSNSMSSTSKDPPAGIMIARDTVSCDVIIARGYFKRILPNPPGMIADSASAKIDTLRRMSDMLKQ